MADQEAIDALAEAWAEVWMDERGLSSTPSVLLVERFRRPTEDLLARLRSRGFDIVRACDEGISKHPAPPMEIGMTDPKSAPTAEEIDRAAKFLREEMSGFGGLWRKGVLLRWDDIPAASKKKWLILAEGTLLAARGTEG